MDECLSFHRSLKNGGNAEVGCTFINTLQYSSFGNTGPGPDPFIIRIHHFLEVAIRENIFWHIAAYSSNGS